MSLTRNDDRVWFSSEIKLQQIRSDVVTAQTAGRNVLVLSNFEQTLTRLGALMMEAGIVYERFSSFHSDSVCSAPKQRVWLGLARAFEPPTLLDTVSESKELDIIVTEHYPLQSKDEELIRIAARLPCRVQLSFHFSLDDPLMKHFGAGSLQQLVMKLGLSEWECISHPLVTKAIRNAQEKIEKTVPRDLPAHSAEDWFKYNLTKL